MVTPTVLEVCKFGFWFKEIVTVKCSGALEERGSEVVGEQDWFSPLLLVFVESTVFLEASGFKD